MTMSSSAAAVLGDAASQELSGRSALSFERGVPRTLVHKLAVSEVLLTDAVRTGSHRFTIAAQWPQHHVLFGSGARPADPLLLLETVRQTGIYISHVHYDVPLNYPFVLTSVDYELTPAAADPAGPVNGGTAPRNVLVDVVTAPETDGTQRFGMSLDAQVVVDGRLLGRVGLCWQALKPGHYERIRFPNGVSSTPVTGPGTLRPELAAPVAPPGTFGRSHPRDTMLAAGPVPGTWALRLDTTHPIYFDHGCDHTPGMALIEAFHQAAALTSGRFAGLEPADVRWTLESSAVAFLAFGELDRPVTITTEHTPESDGPGLQAVRVRAEQDDRLLAVAALIGTVTPASTGAVR
ncbi:ScbA/BarX family gamma-butyrolactone biosynthesis protein [Streptomyces sp. NPDC048603]|uniref:ScbA/BarX family gamma-butyrolactone biosynthesis protein n=1 Tax=Streptomyces sp. NPDC048603 TaxID=3365577 RepID=UPI00371C1571